MARIPEVPLPVADPLARELFDAQEEQRGAVFNTSRILGRRPTILQGHLQLRAGIDASALIPQQLQALLCVRVATINGCPF